VKCFRKADLRKFPENELTDRLLRQAEMIMDQTDALHVRIDLEVIIEELGIEA